MKNFLGDGCVASKAVDVLWFVLVSAVSSIHFDIGRYKLVIDYVNLLHQVLMIMEIKFHIYLATKTKWAHLTKVIDMPAVPRKREFVKFQNAIVGDYFGFEVVDVTYRESGAIEVMTNVLNNVDNRMYSFEEEDEAEFEEYINSYIDEGWICERGIEQNNWTFYTDNC